MKVCILSDSHDHIPLLDAAVAQAVELGAEAVLHCGDIVAPSTLRCLKKYPLPVHFIHGNNSGDLYVLTTMAAQTDNQFHYHGMDAAVNLAGKRIFLVHYPHYARAMAATGDWDLVCCGHTHELAIEQVTNAKGGSTHLVNPGTIGGVGRAPATWILADLDSMSFEQQQVPKLIEQGYSELAG
jgi:putative phosphoesterase